MIHQPARDLPPDSSPPVASTSRIPESLSPDGQLHGDAGDELLDDDYDDGAESASGMVRGAEENVDELETMGSEGAVSRAARQSTNATSQKTQAAFIHKLYSMVSLGRSNFDSLIDWTKDGKAFGVSRPNEFAKVVLPQYFKHSNFASFIRQCNMYSFSKVNDLVPNTAQAQGGPDGGLAWEFQNPFFRRDQPELLSLIKRKSVKFNSVPGSQPANPRTGSASTPVGLRGARLGHVAQPEESGIHTGRREENDLPGAHTEAPTDPCLEHDFVVGIRDKRQEDPSHQIQLTAGNPRDRNRREGSPPGPMPGLRRTASNGSRVSSNYSPAPSFPRAILPPTTQPTRPPFPTPSHSPRPATAGSADSNPLARQVAWLEAHVQSLTNALAESSAIASSAWSNAHTSMRLFLGVLEGFDLTRDQRNQLERCSSLLYGGEVDPSVVLPALTQSPSAQPWPPSWQTASAYGPRAPRPSSSSSTPVAYGQHRPPPTDPYSRVNPLRRPAGSDPFPRPESDIPPSYAWTTTGVPSSEPLYDTTSSAPPGVSVLAHPPTYRPGATSAGASFPGGPLPPSRPTYLGTTGQVRSSETLPSLASLLAGATPIGGMGRPRSSAAEGDDDRGDETKKRRV
ncbi:BQ2448_3181 [Microbotryum intermedium]|uniref:BQ2448_3181 protein n=1 Tax=Microbotryum intermedium TaxID=269621 RepID=A0A238FHW9_9BASI|nr:BQ2448_3181 [Microbotryum intermedium]